MTKIAALTLAAVAVVASATAASADPIFSPVLLSALGGSAGIFGGATGIVASVISAVIVTAVSRDVRVLR